LLATATVSNGTTQAVTSQAQWNSPNVSVADMRDAGAVTVHNLGAGIITAAYEGNPTALPLAS
jgi:hypothetical protein